MPLKEMLEKSPCCIWFLQEILKTKTKPSNEEFIFLKKDCRAMLEMKILEEIDDP